MKTFKIVLLSLICLPLLASKNASATSISCINGNEPWHGELLSLSDSRGGRLSGSLRRAYNGATLACGNSSLKSLLQFRNHFSCAGIWNHGFAADGSSDRNSVITVQFTMEDGKLRASYLENWDKRRNHTPRNVSMSCIIRK